MIVVLHVHLSVFISLNPPLFIPSAVTQPQIGHPHHSAASPPCLNTSSLSGFVLISRILTDSAIPQMFNSLKRQTAF